MDFSQCINRWCRNVAMGQSRHSLGFQRRLLCPQSRPSRCGQQTPLRAKGPNSCTAANGVTTCLMKIDEAREMPAVSAASEDFRMESFGLLAQRRCDIAS